MGKKTTKKSEPISPDFSDRWSNPETSVEKVWDGAVWKEPVHKHTTFLLGDSSDPLTEGTDKYPLPCEAPFGLTIEEVRLKVKTAPTGQALIVDIHKNGVTIFTNQAHRPQIAAGATDGFTIDIDIASLAKGDDITFDIDQVGSSIAGSRLMVEIICEQDS